MDNLDTTWGYASSDMYRQRWALIRPHLAGDAFVLVDWGSDAGWFSISAAKAFPGATVISVESGVMSDGQGLAMHRDKLAALDVSNNVIVDAMFGPATFERLAASPADVQFVLSVFHHMGDGFGRYLNSVVEWDQAFRALVSSANVTFFEVPGHTAENETPHRIEDWFGGREVEEVVQSALDGSGLDATVELLGETAHGSKGERQLFKISHGGETGTVDQIVVAISDDQSATAALPANRARLAAGRLLRTLGLRNKDIVSENE